MRDRSLYEQYIQRTEQIRTLSTLALDHIHCAKDYQDQLKSNFTHIGELAAKNRDFLDRELFALLNSPDIIPEDDSEILTDFSDSLISASNAENLDLSIVSVIQEKLIDDADKNADMDKLFSYYDIQIGVYYELMLTTSRIHSYPGISDAYRKKGFKLVDIYRKAVEKESFSAITDPEIRDMLLTNARYGVSFFEAVSDDPATNEKHLAYLKNLFAIAKDPFYIDLMGKDFDWTYYMFRLYQYATIISEDNNRAGFDKEQLEQIYLWSEEFDAFWKENEAYINRELYETEDYAHTYLSLLRSRYLTGRITREHYLDELITMYDSRNITGYSAGDYCNNLYAPIEIIALLDRDKEHLNEREKALLANLYKNMLSYAFYMPNDGTLIVFLELFCKFMEHFIEIPSAITYEDMMLQSMAALHPPTYVHTQMVGKITECLCSHMIRLMPEKLVGIKDTRTVDEVKEKKDAIIDFAYHSALCHDCGKLFIIDIIFIYGRKLLDMEFNLIKTHPKMGYDHLSRYESTREYAEVALGHHKWHDDSRGYPEEFISKDSKAKAIIDLVMCADCLDAATDNVGRSYNKGKSVESFTEELVAGQNDRYAPWLVDLFNDPLVKEDITYLLSEGREQKYKEIYYLLKNVHEAAEKA